MQRYNYMTNCLNYSCITITLMRSGIQCSPSENTGLTPIWTSKTSSPVKANKHDD